MGPPVFERLVCLKDWYDAEARVQFGLDAFEESGFETESPATDANDDSDIECYPIEESGLWYMFPDNY